MVGTSQKWPAKAGGRSPKGPAVAGTTVSPSSNTGKLLLEGYSQACAAKIKSKIKDNVKMA